MIIITMSIAFIGTIIAFKTINDCNKNKNYVLSDDDDLNDSYYKTSALLY